ncbi:gustatory receptor 5a for trehalose-like [Aphidius gifuensis]|uniref:gustatory receptor 5a for trehalose-like n=1 Tax=Aphidius gifuensis TaxID=684658 RepID=UPI001CDCB035|nr:gustatory receptor 5a for trehalose-like [Aphidius gifuensis]
MAILEVAPSNLNTQLSNTLFLTENKSAGQSIMLFQNQKTINPECFYKAIMPIIMISQLFGIFPITRGSISIGLEEYFLLISGIYPAYIWNFTDIFIILVSLGLAERYKHLNKFAIASSTFNNHENYWNQLRINYSILSNLVKETDNVLSPLIFLSIGHNFFFICLQLFIGVSDSNESDIVKIYRPFSFVFIVMRTIGVLFSAAKINDHSKNILPIIYQCPRSKYNNETYRLQCQLTSDEIALTGMSFFSITKGFILTVAGAIFTYEIILLQFSKAKKI